MFFVISSAMVELLCTTHTKNGGSPLVVPIFPQNFLNFFYLIICTGGYAFWAHDLLSRDYNSNTSFTVKEVIVEENTRDHFARDSTARHNTTGRRYRMNGTKTKERRINKRIIKINTYCIRNEINTYCKETRKN